MPKKTKAQLEAENAELREKLAAAEAAAHQPPHTDYASSLVLGEAYHCAMGLATVTGFYVEDDVDKVRLSVRQLDDRDMKTVLAGQDPFPCSMPVEKFHASMNAWRKDQFQRLELKRRIERKQGKGK